MCVLTNVNVNFIELCDDVPSKKAFLQRRKVRSSHNSFNTVLLNPKKYKKKIEIKSQKESPKKVRFDETIELKG